jgi:glycogenin glucosyltransferase
MCTIASLITSNDFLPGLQTMVHSLKSTLSAADLSATALVCLVTPAVTADVRAKIEQLGVACLNVSELGPPPSGDASVPQWKDTYTKLHVFDPSIYASPPSAVLYIDADCVVCRDPLPAALALSSDPSWPHLSAAPDVFPPDRFNAGVLLLRPAASTFERLISLIPVLRSYDGGDTGFLNAAFPDWHVRRPRPGPELRQPAR